MIRTLLLTTAVVAGISVFTTSVQALDAVPSSPSMRISETLPAPSSIRPPAPGELGVRSPAGNTVRESPSYVYVLPLGRHRDRNADRTPWSGDSDNDGIPDRRDHQPGDPTVQ